MTRSSTQAVLVTMHGGANYSPEEQASAYDSLAAAARTWMWRRDSNGLTRIDGAFFPNWGDPSYQTAIGDGSRHHAAYAYLVDHEDLPDMVANDPSNNWLPVFNVEGMYPDYELTVGPRDGLRWERC